MGKWSRVGWSSAATALAIGIVQTVSGIPLPLRKIFSKAPELSFEAKMGEQRDYAISLESSGSTAAFGMQPFLIQKNLQMTPYWNRLSGILRLTMVDDQIMCHTAAQPCRLLAVVFLNTSGAGQVGGVDLSEELSPVALESHQIFIDLKPDGTVVNLRFSKETTPVIRSQARIVLSFLQVVFPQSPAFEWVQIEQLTAQKAAMHYVISALSERSLSLIRSEKERASDTRAGTLLGTTEFTLSKDGWWQTIIGKRETRTFIQSREIGNERTHLSLNLVASRMVSPTDLASSNAEARDIENTFVSSLSSAAELEKIGDESRKKFVEGENIELVLQRLQNPSDKSTHDRNFLILKILLELHPSAVDQLGDLLKTLKVEQSAFLPVAAALSEAGTPEAQGALQAAMLEHATDEKTFSHLIAFVGNAKNPSETSETLLKEIIANDPRPNVVIIARLNLGVMGRNLLEQSPTRAKGIFEDAVGALKGAKDENDTDVGLSVLGNVGMLEQYNTIEPYLNSPSIRVRRSAVSSLRFDPSPKATLILLDKARHDTQPEVRQKAVESLRFAASSPEIVMSLAQILESESDERVVRESIALLGMTASFIPEAKAALAKFQQNCGKSELSAYVKSILLAESRTL